VTVEKRKTAFLLQTSGYPSLLLSKEIEGSHNDELLSEPEKETQNITIQIAVLLQNPSHPFFVTTGYIFIWSIPEANNEAITKFLKVILDNEK
jgi:hypothetical protein